MVDLDDGRGGERGDGRAPMLCTYAARILAASFIFDVLQEMQPRVHQLLKISGSVYIYTACTHDYLYLFNIGTKDVYGSAVPILSIPLMVNISPQKVSRGIFPTCAR